MTQCPYIEYVLTFSIFASPIAFLIHRTIAKTKDGAHFGIGVRSVQFLGVAMLIPAVTLLAMEHLISGEVVATLFGAFVGYLFSNIGDFDKPGRGKHDP